MHAIYQRETRVAEDQRQAEGRRRDETPLMRMAQRLTSRAKGRRG